jgi:hypothetical protein
MDVSRTDFEVAIRHKEPAQVVQYIRSSRYSVETHYEASSRQSLCQEIW